jgi:hypothetical protein
MRNVKKERSSANFDKRSTVNSEVKQSASTSNKSQADSVWYCASYQRNKCQSKSSHFAVGSCDTVCTFAALAGEMTMFSCLIQSAQLLAHMHID